MNFRNISAWSIRNPIVPHRGLHRPAAGGHRRVPARWTCRTEPDIEFPAVIVSISQPGAAPTEIENQITQRVEAAVQTIDGVETIRSTASRRQFADRHRIRNRHRHRRGGQRGRRTRSTRSAATCPTAFSNRACPSKPTSSQPIVYFGVSADDMTMEQLSWFIDDTVTKRLLTVEGMAEVSRSGGVDREILRDPRPGADAVARRHRQPGQQRAAPAQHQCGRRAGRNRRIAPVGARAGQCRRRLRTVADADRAGRRPHRSSWPISPRCSDGYRRADLASPRSTASRSSPSPSPARAANPTSRVYDDARRSSCRQIEEENPGIDFTRLFTEVDYTKEQYESSMALLIEGALLAVVVVFLFLRDWRATIIAALAIPLSAIPTFWFMDLLGFTLNQMSLLALGLVAGVLVDDAIVEIENIVRHMRMGKSAYQASRSTRPTRSACRWSRPPSVSSRCSCRSALMPGISGQFFKNFGLHRGRLGADEPGGGAYDHADGRGLFPQGQGPGRARRRAADGPLHEGPALVARHQGVRMPCASGPGMFPRAGISMSRPCWSGSDCSRSLRN